MYLASEPRRTAFKGKLYYEDWNRQPMKRHKLGNSDMEITPLGFGSWAVGGSEWAYGWGAQDDQQSIQAIHQALDSGMNWIDTAAVYGLGHSEEVVARAVKGYSGSKPYVFTKCSMVWDESRQVTQSLKRDSIRRECEASLRRLQTEAIDLYQIHWPNPEEDIEEAWGELASLQKEGKLRWIGVSNFSVDQMRRVQPISPITSLQPPYSMLRRAIESEILPFTEENGIGVIVYSPMLSGMLTGGMTHERAATLPADDWRSRNPEFQEPKLSRNLALVDLLSEIGRRHGKTTACVALAWVLRHPAVTAAIVGGRNADQVKGVAPALEFRLSRDEIMEIEDFIETKVNI
jgi:aryl-alcohol dehydrogenase-like predicted oxidoreductase